MVRYWKTNDAVAAKVVKTDEGHSVMYMEGEDYPFPGYPRGDLLYGSLSPLKHLIKNRIFNTSWKNLEEGKDLDVRKALEEVDALFEEGKYNHLPFDAFVPPIKELWRAMTAIEHMSPRIKPLKKVLCFILQEDDAYRFRFQWMTKFFRPRWWWKDTVSKFDLALSMLEHGEIVGDMKERQRLLRRVLVAILKDPVIRDCFEALVKELDWKKLNLSKADKYYFRAKYFKVDWPEWQY